MKKHINHGNEFANPSQNIIDKLTTGLPWFIMGFLAALLLFVFLMNEKPL
jgi:hypothetical protein